MNEMRAERSQGSSWWEGGWLGEGGKGAGRGTVVVRVARVEGGRSREVRMEDSRRRAFQ